MSAEELIAHLGLQPLASEGGYFRETYRALEQFPAGGLPARYGTARPFATAIYYLLTAESFSAIHRLRSDEVYHFYLGEPVEMLLLYPDGRSETIVLGHDILDGHQLQWTVPRDVWQGSRVVPGGRFALLGTTVAPGFDAADFELGSREPLVASYPQAAELIRALTRTKRTTDQQQQRI